MSLLFLAEWKEDAATTKLNKWPFKYDYLYSPVNILNLYCWPLMLTWCYLMDLYWFLHSTIYLNADCIKCFKSKIVVNWEFSRLAAWPALIRLLHLFCCWKTSYPVLRDLFSFRANQVWSVAWRCMQGCISEWQRWDMRWVYAAGMLLGSQAKLSSVVLWWFEWWLCWRPMKV